MKKILVALFVASILLTLLFTFVPSIRAFPNRIQITYYTPIRLTTYDSPLRAFIIVDNDSGREYLVIPGAGITLLEK
jgi:hypothetical protein